MKVNIIQMIHCMKRKNKLEMYEAAYHAWVSNASSFDQMEQRRRNVATMKRVLDMDVLE